MVMQTLWLQFDKIAGKGIDIVVILKFLGYIAQMMVPQALPVAVLLSSIMALGNLSENYEFAAIKSAGISLQQFIRPLVILMVVLSGLNFLFLNYAFPRAAFKFKNLLLDMQKTKPALAFIPGTFNTELPGYSIKFAEKYGENDNLLKDVHIYYDLNKGRGNTKVIKAEKGRIESEEGSKYMTLILQNGYHHEDIIPSKNTYQKLKSMPFTKSYFDEYVVNIDVSELGNFNAADYKEDREMLSLGQLDYYRDSLKPTYDEYIKRKATDFYIRGGVKEMYTDSLFQEKLNPDILQNFDSINKFSVVEAAINLANRSVSDIESFKTSFKNKQKFLNVYDAEYHRRLAFSIACLVLFFIGAPLGSIIRKGGFGVPMILAIIIFVIYISLSTMGRNMAWSSKLTAISGGWLATFILLPLGILLTIRATQDKGIFNLDAFLQPITNFFKRLFGNKKSNVNTK